MMDTKDTILACCGIHKFFGKADAKNHVLRGVDLSIARGEFVAVMGPSGCGKSTLLHILGLMAAANDGLVYFDGQAVDANSPRRTKIRRHNIGVIFQRFNLINTLSAIDNIKISLKVRGLRDKGQAMELLDTMGVSHVAKRKPGQMSIGEQQRVAAARALAHKPDVILADEPTGNLDSESGEALLELLSQINRDNGQTIMMITHSAQAANYAQRTIQMKDGIIHE